MAAAVKGAIRQAEREQRSQQWMAWHIAALSRTDKLPTFERFMGGKRQRPKKQTPEEIMAVLGSLLGPPEEAA